MLINTIKEIETELNNDQLVFVKSEEIQENFSQQSTDIPIGSSYSNGFKKQFSEMHKFLPQLSNLVNTSSTQNSVPDTNTIRKSFSHSQGFKFKSPCLNLNKGLSASEKENVKLEEKEVNQSNAFALSASAKKVQNLIILQSNDLTNEIPPFQKYQDEVVSTVQRIQDYMQKNTRNEIEFQHNALCDLATEQFQIESLSPTRISSFLQNMKQKQSNYQNNTFSRQIQDNAIKQIIENIMFNDCNLPQLVYDQIQSIREQTTSSELQALLSPQISNLSTSSCSTSVSSSKIKEEKIYSSLSQIKGDSDEILEKKKKNLQKKPKKKIFKNGKKSSCPSKKMKNCPRYIIRQIIRSIKIFQNEVQQMIDQVFEKTMVKLNYEEFYNYFLCNIEKFTNIEIIREHWSVKNNDIKDKQNLRNWIFRQFSKFYLDKKAFRYILHGKMNHKKYYLITVRHMLRHIDRPQSYRSNFF